MASPLVFVATFKVKRGQEVELREWYEKIADVVEAKEPQVIAYTAYLSEDGTEMTSVQVHPDTASMERHMSVLTEAADDGWWSRFDELLDGVNVAYYGVPPESALAMDEASGVPIDLKPVHLGGFARKPS